MNKSFQVVVVYIVTHMGLIFFLYPTDIIASGRQSQWMPILTGFVIHFVVLVVYMKGLSYFDRQSIVGVILKKSKLLAWLILFPMSLYLMDVVVVTIRSYSEMLSIVFLSNTPLFALMLLMLAVPACMVFSGGVHSLFRAGLLLGLFFAPPFLFVLIASLQNTDLLYVLPVFPKGEPLFSFFSAPSFYRSMFAVIGGFHFLGLIPPHISYKPKYIYLSSLMILAMLLLSVYIPITKLGEETARRLQFPFIFTVDTVEINWLMFDRVTVFFLLSLIAFVMLHSALNIWQLTYVVRSSFKGTKNAVIIPVLLILIYCAGFLIPNWDDVERVMQWNGYLRGYVAVTLPATVFFLGYFGRKRLKRG